MKQNIEQLVTDALSIISHAETFEVLENQVKQFLGKQGALSEILKSLKDLSVEEKQQIGPMANDAKQTISAAAAERKTFLQRRAIEQDIEETYFDVTLPGKKAQFLEQVGTISPFNQFMQQSVDIFARLGFTIWDGTHIVHDYENFESLNFPEDHPARDMQDTFYLEENYLLRTHTSTLQHRILKKQNFPIRAIVPGKCFRNEATDATHEVIFTQLEGVVVDEHISISNLIAIMKQFLREVFGPEVKTRIRPGYFPFVEPGIELEVDRKSVYGEEDGETKWMEVMPAGMIHPNVLEEAGIDSQKYSGFAFGFGISRMAQLKYGISDTRLLFAQDSKYLKQFLSM